MDTESSDTVAGVTVPDTELIGDVTDFIRDAEDDLLFNHSRRVFFFGVLQGRSRRSSARPGMLYVGAMFHDLGLTEPYRTSSSLRFEVDGANAARDFLLQHGSMKQKHAEFGFASHCTRHPESPIPRPGNCLGHRGSRDRRAGLRPWRPSAPGDLSAVTSAHPRPDFKRCILEAFTEGMKHRPRTTFGTMNADVLAHYDPSFVRDDFVKPSSQQLARIARAGNCHCEHHATLRCTGCPTA